MSRLRPRLTVYRAGSIVRHMVNYREERLVHALLSNEDSARSHEGGWSGALKKLTRRFSASVDVTSR